MVTVKKVYTKRGKGIAGIGSLSRGPTAVKVGFIKGEADADVIQRAIWQEFGTRGGASGGGWGGPVPERPFMRNAMRENTSGYRNLLRKEATRIVQAVAMGNSGDVAKSAALSRLGIRAQGDIQGMITAIVSPPNAPATIALKGSSKPLIDTGELRNSVAWKLDE
ncbi:hypothetical protein [Shinella sp. JR1-6]|uniref:hypothetical protein n=1 Tax=Shinella sp. JR1-6 TaxID=2527671 RepID=UPI00102D642B|nr:hypothetical protein [Shinella sp. JR1-6]TAA61872.1 hypothetical protein EXZ48_12170 [Shinella sp. JR1-6]